jgi:ABC-type uncharacterized transport system substrate-binding protein
MERKPTRRCLAALIAAVGVGNSHIAAAHPHMWIEAKAQVKFDAQGRVSALRQVWQFDEMFAAYAMQGLKKAKDGSLSQAQLQNMASDWMKALGDPMSHYFTRVSVAGKTVPLAAPRDAQVRWDPQSAYLGLEFTLPLTQPVAPDKAGLQVDIYDPTYFVAYSFKQEGAIILTDAPASCQQIYHPPRELDFATLQRLAAIPADPQALPAELYAITQGLTHRIKVQCL